MKLKIHLTHEFKKKTITTKNLVLALCVLLVVRWTHTAEILGKNNIQSDYHTHTYTSLSYVNDFSYTDRGIRTSSLHCTQYVLS